MDDDFLANFMGIIAYGLVYLALGWLLTNTIGFGPACSTHRLVVLLFPAPLAILSGFIVRRRYRASNNKPT